MSWPLPWWLVFVLGGLGMLLVLLGVVAVLIWAAERYDRAVRQRGW